MTDRRFRLLHISDTHGKHRELSEMPAADIIVHSGDFTFGGSEEEVYDFVNWFCDLPYKHKIFIAGNHDDCLCGADLSGIDANCHYLNNSAVEIEGLKFYGIPLFMQDVMDGHLQKMYRQIPDDTDILITHQPPYSVCDLADYGNGLEHRGNRDLAARIAQLHLKYHLFGHEHDTYGVAKQDDTVFSNAAVVDVNYKLIRKPRLFLL
jgi:Icc-related predicted phosphoesterase